MQMESLNMMTKYQIVYLKLETALKNIARTADARLLLRRRRAFAKWKQTSAVHA